MRKLLYVFCTVLLAGCGSQPAPPPQSTQSAQSGSFTPTSKSPEAIAHVEKGAALADNLRPEEALAEFDAALKLDPGFALARAERGRATQGVEGLKEIEAAAAAKNLSEPERAMIDGILATRRGESGAAVTAFRRLTELTPGYSRGHYLLGFVLLNQQQDFDAAVASLKKATSLNPNDGGAQNMLGYAALRQGDADGAMAAFNEYVRILPQEPNAQDSLGEALLAGGRFKEAEAAFEKSLQLSPEFWAAHEGIAFARFFAGDWAGGRDALMKARATAVSRGDKMGIDVELSAAALAQNKTAEALQILEASAKTEGATAADLAFIPVRRAQILVVAGRARDAFAPIADALKSAESGELPPAPTRNLRRQSLRARIAAEALLKDAMAAQKTSSALDMDAASRPEDINAQTAMHFGRGLLAVASGDMTGARSHFDQCAPSDELCKWEGVKAAEKLGDKAGMAAARDAVLKLYLRDATHLIVRSRLTH